MNDHISVCSIENWLEAVTPDFEFIQVVDQPPQAHRISTKRRLMTTPPTLSSGSQNQRRDRSPTKRQRIASTDKYGDNVEDPALGVDDPFFNQ